MATKPFPFEVAEPYVKTVLSEAGVTPAMVKHLGSAADMSADNGPNRCLLSVDHCLLRPHATLPQYFSVELTFELNDAIKTTDEVGDALRSVAPLWVSVKEKASLRLLATFNEHRLGKGLPPIGVYLDEEALEVASGADKAKHRANPYNQRHTAMLRLGFELWWQRATKKGPGPSVNERRGPYNALGVRLERPAYYAASDEQRGAHDNNPYNQPEPLTGTAAGRGGPRDALLELASIAACWGEGEEESVAVVGATIEPVTPEMEFEDQEEPLAAGWWLLRVSVVGVTPLPEPKLGVREFLVRTESGMDPIMAGIGDHVILPCGLLSFVGSAWRDEDGGTEAQLQVRAVLAKNSLLVQQRDEARRLARALKNGDASPEEVQAAAAWLYEGDEDEDENADDFDSEQDVDGEPDGVLTIQATATSGTLPEGGSVTMDPQATVSVVGLDGREMRPPAPSRNDSRHQTYEETVERIGMLEFVVNGCAKALGLPPFAGHRPEGRWADNLARMSVPLLKAVRGLAAGHRGERGEAESQEDSAPTPVTPTSPPCGCTSGARDPWSCGNGNIPGVCTRRGPCGCACHIAKAQPSERAGPAAPTHGAGGEFKPVTFHVDPSGPRSWAALAAQIGQQAIIMIHGANGLGKGVLADAFASARPGATVLRAPEAGLAPAPLMGLIKDAVANAAPDRPLVIVTHSLFVMREVLLTERPVCWVSLHPAPIGGVTAMVGPDIADTGDVLALDAELAQAERYMDWVIRRGNKAGPA